NGALKTSSGFLAKSSIVEVLSVQWMEYHYKDFQVKK
ncbi:ZFYVE16 isoform 13, partial [Pongo abelii]